MNGNELGDGLSVFGDNDAVRVYAIEQRQALLFEFSGRYSFHNKTIIQSRLFF